MIAGALSDALALGFLRDAVIAAALASVLCGIVGVFVVVKRLVVVVGGVSHAAFGGLGACYFLGLPPLLGAIVSAVLTAVAVGWPSEGRGRADATVGVLWALGMALGMLFIHLTPGHAPNLMGFLFGDVLSASTLEVTVLGVLVLGVVAAVTVFHEDLEAVAFDEVHATVQGLAVRGLRTVLLLVTGVTVVLLMRVVGFLLVMALLCVPPLIALSLVRRFHQALACSVAAALVMTLGGLAASFALDLPSGPAIILVGAALLAATRAAVAVVGHARRGDVTVRTGARGG